MKNLKKKALMAASYVAVAALAVGGTFAHFTDDEESKMNTFTNGEAVDIVINEYQRNDDGTALEEFEQGKALYPIVGGAQESTEDGKTNMDKYGMPSADAAKNYVDKIVTVENTGQADAYVRVFVAIPTALLGESIEDDSDDVLHWNWGNRVDIYGNYSKADYKLANWGWAWQNEDETLIDPEFTAMIDDQEYIVSTFYYTKALKPESITTAVMGGLYLDKDVDYDNGVYIKGNSVINYDLSKGVTVPIFADAVEATGAEGETYKTAFESRPAVDVFETWAENVEAPVLVESAEELTAALENGESVILAEDIQLSAYLNITAAKEISIDLNGHNITRDGGTAIYVNNKDAVVNIEGNGEVTGLDVIYVNAGTVNIYGGTYTNTGDVTVYAFTSEANINIYDGTFSSPDGSFVLNLKDGSNGDITVFGGTFVGFDPANNASENPQQSFVANGYESVDNGNGTYTVVKSAE